MFATLLMGETCFQINLGIDAPGMRYAQNNHFAHMGDKNTTNAGFSPSLEILTSAKNPRLLVGSGVEMQLNRKLTEENNQISINYQAVFAVAHYRFLTKSNTHWEATANLGYDRLFQDNLYDESKGGTVSLNGGAYWAAGFGMVYHKNICTNLLYRQHSAHARYTYKNWPVDKTAIVQSDITLQLGYRF
jgi:hypothetical protein